MPIIKSSADLRNDYKGISTICHTYNEPVFITKNGKGDLAVLSIEAYEQLVASVKSFEDDPFYNEENINRLKAAMKDAEAGKNMHEHEIVKSKKKK